jgi:cell wall-associated NlpC family hydrolase
MTRADVVSEARDWLQTPWRHQQRHKGVAVDCVGLVIGVCRSLGLVATDFDVNGYSRRPDGTLLAQCAQLMRPIRRDDMQAGDVLVVATDSEPAHMGILADYRHGGLSLIHAANGIGVVEHRLMFARNLKFKGAYALPGIA